MTLNPHEVIKIHLGLIHQNYKGKTGTLRLRADSGVYTTHGGTEKTFTDYAIDIIINPVANPKTWGPMAIMGESTLEAIIWAGFDSPMGQQFFVNNPVSNMDLIIGTAHFRIQNVKSPESIITDIPYWYVLLEKVQHEDD